VDLPETLIQQEVTAILNETATTFARQGVDVRRLFTQELIEQLRQGSREEAINRLKRTIALGELAKLEGIEINDEAVELKAKQLLSQASDPQNIDPVKLRQVVAEDLLQDKLMEWFEQNLTVELVPVGSLSPEAEAPAESAETSGEAAEVEATAPAKTAKKRKSSAAGASETEMGEPVASTEPTASTELVAEATPEVMMSEASAADGSAEPKAKRTRKKAV
jgi:trigger factor